MTVTGCMPGRALLTLIASFVVTFFQLGSAKAFGVLVPELSEQLSLNMWQIGLSGGICFSVRALLGPMWSALARIFPYRHITILGGLVSSVGIWCAGLSVSWLQLNIGMFLLGVGHGLPMVVKVVALKDHFKDNFAMATGISFSGGALGMIVFPPLMEMGITTYGWRGAMFLYGVLNLHVSVVGMLMITPPKAISNTRTKYEILKNNEEETSCIRYVKVLSNLLGMTIILKNPLASVYFVAFSLHSITLTGWLTFLVSYTISIGYSNQIASYLSALAGVGALWGRILYALLLDRSLVSGKAVFCVLAVGGALSVASYPFTNLYWLLSIITLFTGLFMTSVPSVYIIILHELFPNDSETFTSAVGLHYMARGIGRAVGGPLTGQLYEWNEDFHTSFVVLAAIEAVVALLIFIMLMLPSRWKQISP